MLHRIILLLCLSINQDMCSYEHIGILETLKATHNPLTAHDKIMDFSQHHGKISNYSLFALFNRAQALKNYSAQIHISNSYQICKSTNAKNTPYHPIGCVGHITQSNLITLLAEISPFKNTKHAVEYETFKNQAQHIIKSAVEEKNMFAFLVHTLIKNATMTGMQGTTKLFDQITELLIATRQNNAYVINNDLLTYILSFTHVKQLDFNNAEAIYSYILLKMCMQEPRLSRSSSLYPACVLGYLQKYTQFEELDFWTGVMLFNATNCDLIRSEGLRLLLKSKLVPVYWKSKNDFMLFKKTTAQKKFNDYLETIDFSVYPLTDTIQLYEPGIMILAASESTYAAYVQYQIIKCCPFFDHEYYATFLKHNSHQAFRNTHNIRLKTFNTDTGLPLLAVYRKVDIEDIIATLTPTTCENSSFNLSTFYVDDAITPAESSLIEFYGIWFSKNPNPTFGQQEIWYYNNMFDKARAFYNRLENKDILNKPRLTRQSSDPLPLTLSKARLQQKELIVKKFTVSFHEEILSSSSDEEPKNDNAQ